MFDVLWGRWPQWSEMYNIYSYVNETRVGQTANLIRFGPTWSVDPIKDMNFSLSYNALFADQDVPTQATVPVRPGLFTGNGELSRPLPPVRPQIQVHQTPERPALGNASSRATFTQQTET